eukprot:10960282-Alexandrium_andersonii.AAC.1
MSASLVGSEMCIRDRCHPTSTTTSSVPAHPQATVWLSWGGAGPRGGIGSCLLYTSDAADDM